MSLSERGPFCTLQSFPCPRAGAAPRVLVVAPLSGHRSVLLHDVIAGLLPDHDVHLTDWSDAREVPLAAGAFGLEDNVAYVRELIADS